MIKDTNFVSDKKLPQKQIPMMTKNKQAIKEHDSKKLVRMRSDFTGFNKLSDPIPKPKIPTVSDKVR